MSQLPASSINLLTKRRHSYDKSLQALQKAKIYAGITLVVYGGLMFAAFSIDGVMGLQVDRLNSEANKLRLAISSQAANEQKTLTVVTKARSIEKLIGKRRLITDIWNLTRSMLPEGAQITGFNIIDSKLVVGIRAPHIVKAVTILDILEQNKQGYVVTQSEVSVTRPEDATYSLQVQMSLGAGLTEEAEEEHEEEVFEGEVVYEEE
jgi:hypothetical protein